MTSTEQLKLLWLLQLSDSALPIGAMNQSFGLESMVTEETLTTDQLEAFLIDYLCEVGKFECLFGGHAFRLGAASQLLDQRWQELNLKFSAFRLARESRLASATLGRRFLELAASLSQSAMLAKALATARLAGFEIHHAIAFGLTGGALGIDEEATLLAYLNQTTANLVSACQRLLPLGQKQATRILWELKPVMVSLASEASNSAFDLDEAACFMPLVELSSMRHPSLSTRLFIS